MPFVATYMNLESVVLSEVIQTEKEKHWCSFAKLVSNYLQTHRPQHARLLPFTISWSVLKLMILSQWCHPTISSSVIPFSFCVKSFSASVSFPVSQLFPSGGQSIGASASASFLPTNVQGWLPLVLTGLISLWSQGLSGVFASTTIQKHQFFGT